MSLSIELGMQRDFLRGVRGRNGYEWWYFDGYDASTGWSLVSIFFRGIPFSGARQRAAHLAAVRATVEEADDFPAVAFSLYGPKRTEAYMVNLFPRSELWIADDGFSIRIGKNRARLVDGTWVIELDDELLDGRSVRGTIRLTPEYLLEPDRPSWQSDDHIWVVAAPRCRLEAELMIGGERIVLSGFGYHDHNVGESGLQDQFERWEWGRAHFAGETLIYYRVVGNDGKVDAHAIRLDENGARYTSPDVHHQFHLSNFYRLGYPARLLIVDEDGTRFEVDQGRIVDNGPFYLRFLSTFRRNGESVSGFSEVLRPQALDWRWFWPLLDSRVRPSGSRDRIGRLITNWLIARGF